MTDGIDEFDDQALQVLGDYLLSDRAPENGLGLSDLDGFLTALIVGPELVQPGEWLPVVWGGEEPQFENLDEANAVISAIFSRNNQIIRELEEGDLGPLFWERPGGVVIAADWCEGFMDRVRLRLDSWQPLFQDEEGSKLIYPILALCSDENGSNLLGLDENAEEKVAKDAPDLIPACVLGIYEFWRERVPEPESAAIGAATVGRLTMCACGSGQPYEECCGVK